MEYCPEVAVLHSAFNLVSKTVGQDGLKLSTLSKGDCQRSVSILHTAIQEVTRGLEYDYSETENIVWQKKLHGLVFYKLLKMTYIPSPEPVTKDSTPVYSSMDILSRLVPLFSKELFFELVKCCNWTSLFLKSLQYISASVSEPLFRDFILHCASDPVTSCDTEVISMVTDSLISLILSLPDEEDTLTQAILSPLLEKSKSLTAPDHFYNGEFKEPVPDPTTDDSCKGVWFLWQQLLQGGSDILKILVDKLTGLPDCDDTQSWLDKNTKILVWTGLLSVVSLTDCYTDIENWLTVNLFSTSDQSQTEAQSTRRCFCFNPGLSYLISHCDVSREILTCLRDNLLKYAGKVNLKDTDMLQTSMRSVETCTETKDGENMENSLEQTQATVSHSMKSKGAILNGDVENIFTGAINAEMSVMLPSDVVISSKHVCLKLSSFLRMIEGCLSDWLTDTDREPGCSEVEELVSLCVQQVRTLIKENKDRNDTERRQDVDVSVGDTWRDDLSLDAVLWRINQRLSGYTTCIDRLLSQSCRTFWRDDRLIKVLMNNVDLLANKDTVNSLMEIYDEVRGQPLSSSGVTGDTRDSVHQLMLMAFSEMCSADQDCVVTETYTSTESNVNSQLRDKGRITEVFNRLTCAKEPEVLKEVLRIALSSPREVIRTAVEMSVRNEEQAKNMAEILIELRQLCSSHHAVHHPDVSLLISVLDDMLSTRSLDRKEQGHFITFIRTLLQLSAENDSNDNTAIVLKPIKFLESSVIPAICIENLEENNQPISCEFALRLLDSILDACSDERDIDFDWAGFEPLAVIVTLSWLLQSCVVLWKEDDVSNNNGFVKVVVKELTLKCLDKMTSVLHLEEFSADDNKNEWLVTELHPLHWTVQAKIYFSLSGLQFEQLKESLSQEMNYFMETVTSQPERLVPLLQFVASSEEALLCMQGTSTLTGSLNYENIIISLIQVLPNLLVEEWDRVVRFTGRLVEQGLVFIPYRTGHMTCFTLADLTGIRQALGLSHILQDVLTTLTHVTMTTSQSEAMLLHTSQCYVAMVQRLADTENVVYSLDLGLVLLSEVFNHVCEVTFCLIGRSTENTLVLLLHLQTVYQDTKRSSKVKVHPQIVQNCDSVVSLAVERLPVDNIQTDMLIKKMNEGQSV